jgi:enediyne biosynthesis protein E7
MVLDNRPRPQGPGEPVTHIRPPGPPPGRLGLTQATALRRDPLGFVRGLVAEYGDVVHFRLGPSPCYLFAHPDHVHEILVRQARHFRKTARFKRVFGRFEGEGLLTSDGDAWAVRRRRVQPAFQPSAIDAHAEAVREIAVRVIDGWKVPGEVNLSAEMPGLVGRVVAGTLFGIDVDDFADRLGEIATARQRWAHRELNRIMPTPPWLPLFGEPRRAQSALRAIANRIVRAGRGPGWADGRRQRDQLAGLFLAAFETTAIALAWAGWLIARRPDVQEQIAAEPLGSVTADLAFREALRLYPPVHLFSRAAAERVEVAGYTLPPGCEVFLSPYLTHRDPRWYAEPDRFDPSRFAPDAESKRPACAWFPFGAGPRACVGRRLALLTGATVLSLLASRFRLEAVNDPAPEGQLFLTPKGDVTVRIRSRRP